MTKIYRLAQLSIAKQLLLLTTFILLASVTLGLRVLQFQTLRRILNIIARRSGKLLLFDQASEDQLVWAVKVASCYIPAAVCLPQALTVQLLLKCRRVPAKLRIGVATDDAGQLQAHAWVESHGQVLIGALEDLSRFEPLSHSLKGNQL